MSSRCHPIHSLLALIAATVAACAGASEWQTVSPGGETRCATGTPFKFHVRRADPEKVMIFFNGGGACWSARDCDVGEAAPGKAEHDGTYQLEHAYRPFATPGAGNHPRVFDGAFALDNPENPFADWSQVFVSYCTGDLHLGTADRTYQREDGSEFTIHHRGRINAQAALDYVYEQFPEPKRLFVSGSSAGAIASPFFAGVLADHYPQADTVHFAGGSGIYRLGVPTQLWRLWGVFDQLPPVYADRGQSAANTALRDLYRMANEAAPGIAFHQFDHAYDAVQKQGQERLGGPVDTLEALNANRERLHEALPHFAGYTAPGRFHTVLRFEELYRQSTDGVSAVDWVRSIAEGQAVENVHCGDAAACR